MKQHEGTKRYGKDTRNYYVCLEYLCCSLQMFTTKQGPNETATHKFNFLPYSFMYVIIGTMQSSPTASFLEKSHCSSMV